MTAVIPFPVNRVRKPTPEDEKRLAMVIFFPGERFERLDFSLADRLPPRSGGGALHARLPDWE